MTSTTSKIFDETQYLEFLLKKDGIFSIDDIPAQSSNNILLNNLYLSQIAFNVKDYSKSKEYALKVIQEPENSHLLVAESYNMLGRIARLYKLDQDANAFYDSAKKNFLNSDTFFAEFGIIRLEFNQANLSLLKSELSEASKSYENLLTKINQLKPKNQLEFEINKIKIKILQNSGLTYLYQGKISESKESFERAIEFVPYVAQTTIEADLYLNYSNLTLIQEDYDLSYSLLTKANIIYKKHNKIELFSKTEIDKVKLNLIKNIDNTIDPMLIENLILSFEQAKGTDVNLRIIEINELLLSKGRIDEAKKLNSYLLKKDFLPDLRGKILFMSMNISAIENKNEEVLKIGEELTDIIIQLNDKESLLPINLLLLKANFMLKKDTKSLVKQLKGFIAELVKTNEIESAINSYEQYLPILFDLKEFQIILDLLLQVETIVLKKFDDKHVKAYHEHDLVIIYSITKQEKAKKIFSKLNESCEEIFKISRFKRKIEEFSDLEKEIREFLYNA